MLTLTLKINNLITYAQINLFRSIFLNLFTLCIVFSLCSIQIISCSTSTLKYRNIHKYRGERKTTRPPLPKLNLHICVSGTWIPIRTQEKNSKHTRWIPIENDARPNAYLNKCLSCLIDCYHPLRRENGDFAEITLFIGRCKINTNIFDIWVSCKLGKIVPAIWWRTKSMMYERKRSNCKRGIRNIAGYWMSLQDRFLLFN